jgi:hypothetical protein
MSDITEHPDPRDADLVRRLTNRLADGITSVTLDSSTTPPTVSFTPDESLMAEALADLSRLREERDALIGALANLNPHIAEPFAPDCWPACRFCDASAFWRDRETGVYEFDHVEGCPLPLILPPVAPSPDPNGGEQ